MQSFSQMHDACNNSGHPCCYWGEHGDWLIALGQNRDSDALGRSNFRSMLRKLGGPDVNVVIERESHWACGWVEFILVRPDSAAHTTAQSIKDALEDYPVVDESDWSELEHEECMEIWRNCLDFRERITYIREHGHTIHNLKELFEAVRGDWYAAGNILHCSSDLLS